MTKEVSHRLRSALKFKVLMRDPSNRRIMEVILRMSQAPMFATLQPAVVVIEHNPTIPNHIIYVQEKNEAIRQGTSLAAMCELAASKGYRLVETTLYNGIFVRDCLWELFAPHLPDAGAAASATIDHLHHPSMLTDLWQLYDGSLCIAGCKKLLWHRIPMDIKKMQVLPPAAGNTFPFAPPTAAQPAPHRTQKPKKGPQKKPASSGGGDGSGDAKP